MSNEIRRSALTADEISSLRSATPGCAHVMHFNHAGSSLMPQTVLDTVTNHLLLEANIGGYEAADFAAERSEAVYVSVARLMGARPKEIALVENATRAWDMAFYSIPFKPGDYILTSQSEYASNFIAFLQMRQRGVETAVIPNDSSGEVSLEALERMLEPSVRLVAITHMPTNSGLVQPVEAIGRLARSNGSLFLVDACQTAGQTPIDVSTIGCDFLSATSRKYLRGPRGAGFLFVREDLIEHLSPPFLDLHAARWVERNRYEVRTDARKFENWERNVAGLLGMGAAVDLALEIGLERIWATVTQNANHLRDALTEVNWVTVRDIGSTQGGIVTFDIDGVDAVEINDILRSKAINTSTSSAFSTRIDMEERGLEKVVRASAHYLTTKEEIDALVSAVAEIAQDR